METSWKNFRRDDLISKSEILWVKSQARPKSSEMKRQILNMSQEMKSAWNEKLMKWDAYDYESIKQPSLQSEESVHF